LLGGLGGFANVGGYLVNPAVLSDLRVAAACLLLGAVLGLVNIYVTGLVVTWLGRLMGSSAGLADIRAVLAWGLAPCILAIGLTIVLGAGAHALVSLPGALLAVASGGLLGIGGLWSIIITWLMLSRIQGVTWWRTLIAYLLGVLMIPLLAAMVIRTLLFQPFDLSSGSMSPTLLKGDYVFVSKYAYGYSRYSLPFAPAGFDKRIFAADPQLGDLVVFVLPKNHSASYIKRVVGLAGDRVQIKAGELYINGVAVTRERLPDISGEELCGPQNLPVRQWRETLPNGTSYNTLDCVNGGFYDETVEYKVPLGHVFVLGDNRDNSSDSRVLATFGYVPLENVFGRVRMIFLSLVNEANGKASIRVERIGKIVY
jgi:signal peptidase I